MTTNKTLTYKKLCTEFYNLEMDQRQSTQDALNFFMQYAQDANGPILEPMCGSGRFLIPMLKEGFDIEGFDASEQMIDTLQEKYAEISTKSAPVSKTFIQDFSSEKKYKLIFVPFGSWGLITDIQESKKALHIMFNHLLPGGKLVLEIETIKSLPKPLGVWQQATNTRLDGSLLVLNTLTSYDNDKQLFKSICRYDSIVNNIVKETEYEDFYQYLYRFDEMDLLLEQSKFRQIKKYKNYKKESGANHETPIIIYECVKEL